MVQDGQRSAGAGGGYKLVLGCVALIAFGVLMLGALLGDAQEMRAARNWPRAGAEIINTQVYRSGRARLWCLEVQYLYSVGGRAYAATRWSLDKNERCYAGKRAALAALAEYSRGQQLEIRYKPAAPGEACVLVGQLGAAHLLQAGAALLSLVLAGLLVVSRIRRRVALVQG